MNYPKFEARPVCSAPPRIISIGVHHRGLDGARPEPHLWSLDQAQSLHLIAAILMTLLFFYASAIPLAFATPDFASRMATMAASSPAERGRTFDWLANIAVFIPLGFAWAGAGCSAIESHPRRWPIVARSAGLCLCLACLAEVMQFWLPLRVPSFRDIVALETGAIAGNGLWLIAGRGSMQAVARVIQGFSSRQRRWYVKLKSPVLFCLVFAALLAVNATAKPADWFEIYRHRRLVQHHVIGAAANDLGAILLVSCLAALIVVAICRLCERGLAFRAPSDEAIDQAKEAPRRLPKRAA